MRQHVFAFLAAVVLVTASPVLVTYWLPARADESSALFAKCEQVIGDTVLAIHCYPYPPPPGSQMCVRRLLLSLGSRHLSVSRTNLAIALHRDVADIASRLVSRLLRTEPARLQPLQWSVVAAGHAVDTMVALQLAVDCQESRR